MDHMMQTIRAMADCHHPKDSLWQEFIVYILASYFTHKSLKIKEKPSQLYNFAQFPFILATFV